MGLSLAYGAIALTPAALVRVRALARLIAGDTARLLRRHDRRLAAQGYDPVRRRALLAVTPAGAAGILGGRRAVSRFTEAVGYQGRRLARLNVSPAEVLQSLGEFDGLLDAVVGDRFGPAREQVRLATTLALNHAFYCVREVEAQAFFGLAQAEAAATSLEDLLGRFANVLTRTLSASSGSVVLTPAGQPPGLRRPRYITGAPAGRLVRDPELLARGVCWWSCPVGDDVGVIQLAFPTPYPWLPRELQLLRSAAERCRLAVERVRLIGDLADRERQVRRLAAEARCAEEAERRRIGRDLHDDTGQSLLVLRLQLEMLERQAPDELRSRLAELRAGVERNVSDLRRTIAALSPDLLDRLGLAASLRHLAERFRMRCGMPLQVRVGRRADSVTGETAEVVYRVAQEALSNVARHARASSVNLYLASADRTVKLSVVDDGAGFDAEAALEKPLSFGLSGMRERAGLAGGTLQIRSAPGKGTTVRLELPRRFAGTDT